MHSHGQITMLGLSLRVNNDQNILTESQQKLSAMPQVYVGEMKWSFLHNGAQRCMTDVHTSYSVYDSTMMDWILIKCLNKPVGRFISLIFTSELGRINLWHLLNSVHIVQFITKESKFVMTAGTVNAAEISSFALMHFLPRL